VFRPSGDDLNRALPFDQRNPTLMKDSQRSQVGMFRLTRSVGGRSYREGVVVSSGLVEEVRNVSSQSLIVMRVEKKNR